MPSSQIAEVQYSQGQKTANQQLGLTISNGQVTITGTRSGSRNSNNFNHMVSVLYKDQSSLTYQTTAARYNHTIGLTGISLAFTPVMPGIASVDGNVAAISQYIPFSSNQFNTDLIPVPGTIIPPSKQITDNIFVKKLSFIAAKVNDHKGYVATSDAEDGAYSKFSFKLDPDTSKTDTLDAYGKTTNLSVEVTSTLPADLSQLDSKTISEVLEYFNPDTKSLEIPIKFTYDQTSSGQANQTKDLTSNPNYVTVPLTDDQAAQLNNLAKVSQKEKIDAEATKVKKEIDADNTLTADQKTAQKAAVDTEANTAKTAIDNAKGTDAVNKATDAGIKAIDDQHKAGDLNKAKEQACADIDAKATKVKGEIDDDPTLT
ncbi:DUF1542 domain-containing protein, partial [Pediococcus acidilactici]